MECSGLTWRPSIIIQLISMPGNGNPSNLSIYARIFIMRFQWILNYCVAKYEFPTVLGRDRVVFGTLAFQSGVVGSFRKAV
jgi:hypothetical protein